MVVWEVLIEIFIALQAFWFLSFGRILSIDKAKTDFPWRYFLTTNLIFSLAVTNKAVSAWLAMWSQRKLLFFVLNFAKKRHSWELPSYILIVLQLLTVTSSHKKVKGKEAKREKKKFTKWNLLKLQRQFLIVYMGPNFVWSHTFFFTDLNFYGFLHNRMYS